VNHCVNSETIFDLKLRAFVVFKELEDLAHEEAAVVWRLSSHATKVTVNISFGFHVNHNGKRDIRLSASTTTRSVEYSPPALIRSSLIEKKQVDYNETINCRFFSKE
jgi:hypothetical protein